MTTNTAVPQSEWGCSVNKKESPIVMTGYESFLMTAALLAVRQRKKHRKDVVGIEKEKTPEQKRAEEIKVWNQAVEAKKRSKKP